MPRRRDPAVWTRAGDRLLLSRPDAIARASRRVDATVASVRESHPRRRGRSWPEGQSEPRLGTQEIPALVADSAAGRAYVIQPDGPAADVSLDSLDVSYHELGPASLATRLSAWLQPVAQAKGMNGTAWNGVALGNGFLMITAPPSLRSSLSPSNVDSPAGLAMSTPELTIRSARVATPWRSRRLSRHRTERTSTSNADGLGLAAYGSYTSFASTSSQRLRLVDQTGRTSRTHPTANHGRELATARVVEHASAHAHFLLP